MCLFVAPLVNALGRLFAAAEARKEGEEKEEIQEGHGSMFNKAWRLSNELAGTLCWSPEGCGLPRMPSPKPRATGFAESE